MISTHVLDVSRGKPAPGILVTLEQRTAEGNWTPVGHGETDADGRVAHLTGEEPVTRGTFRLTFDTMTYFRERRAETLYPEVIVVFEVTDSSQRYHLPLLLSPWGYSTYRGS